MPGLINPNLEKLKQKDVGQKNMFVHSVYFWLKPDLTEEQRHLWPGGGYLGSASTWPHTAGGLAEQLVVRRDQIRPLPASLPVRRAALAEPLAVGLHGLAVGGAGSAGGGVFIRIRRYECACGG